MHMAQGFAKQWIRTSVNVSPEFYKLTRQHLIKFSEALRIGISIMLAEKGVIPYDNQLNIVRRINYYKKEAQGWAVKASKLQSKQDKKIGEDGENDNKKTTK